MCLHKNVKVVILGKSCLWTRIRRNPLSGPWKDYIKIIMPRIGEEGQRIP